MFDEGKCSYNGSILQMEWANYKVQGCAINNKYLHRSFQQKIYFRGTSQPSQAFHLICLLLDPHTFLSPVLVGYIFQIIICYYRCLKIIRRFQ